MSKSLSHQLLALAAATFAAASLSAQPAGKLASPAGAERALSPAAIASGELTLPAPEQGPGTAVSAVSRLVLPSYNPHGIMPAPGRASSTTGALPYLQEFEELDNFSTLTIIDIHDDDKKWKWYPRMPLAWARIIQSRDNPKDDWMILPAMQFEPGKVYKLAYKVASTTAPNRPTKEKIEVKMGGANTVEGMTTVLTPEMEVNTADQWLVVEKNFSVETAGTYYIGFHACSDPNQYYLHLDSIAVDAGSVAGVPGAVTDFTATPDPAGALKATVAGKAPAFYLDSQTPTTIDRVEIRRDSVLIKTLTGIAPGADFSYTDESVTNGYHTYSAQAFNATGAGPETSVTTYVGFRVPAATAGITLTETSTGVVRIDWQPVNTDIEGRTLPEGAVKYTVVDLLNGNNVLAQNLTAATFTHTAVQTGQHFCQYGVIATTSVGQSEGAVSRLIAIGTPYAFPFFESFANLQLTDGQELGFDIIEHNSLSKPQLIFRNEGSYQGHQPFDNDNGYGTIRTYMVEDKACVYTGKIDLTNAQNPWFNFATFNYATINNDGERVDSDINIIDVVVREANDTAWTVIRHATVNELCNNVPAAWHRVRIPMTAFKGKVVQVGLRVTCKRFQLTAFDALEVSEFRNNDLAASTITAPATTAPNTEFNVMFHVKNNGTTPTGAYTVEFYREGNPTPIQTDEGVNVAPDQSEVFALTTSLGVTDADASAKYYAKVVFAADEDNANNVSEAVTVTRKFSTRPAPTGLAGTAIGSNNHLTWNAPAYAPRTAAAPVTETFDDRESWAQQLDHWTFIDGDDSPVGGFQNITLPGITAGTSKLAFTVFDNSADQFNGSFDAHSGNKFLAAIFRYDGGTTDDWCILPELDGSAQTITFWAKSYSSQYPEKIRMMTSATTAEPASFTAVQTVTPVPGTWTQYTVEVPAGTKYFAINSCAADAFMLMVDDITFRPKYNELLGYNIYRNGVKVNDTPVTDLYYDDHVARGTYDYHVTAVYGDGVESAPAYAQITNGVDGVQAGVSVSTEPGKVIVTGAEGLRVSVADVKGVAYFRGTAAGNVAVSVAPGVYLVKVGDRIHKLLVR